MRVQFDHLRADRRTLAVIALAIAFFVQTAVRGDDRLLESPREPFTGFDAFVNEAIRGWEVPGLAIAVVKNGKTILARGYGYRDVAKKLPVTPTTIFAIVSCSKAFTTFMMGMLVDEGTLEWNRPVRTYLSEFRLYDRVATELITPRDLVTHRSGLPRHDLLWYNASLSRKELVERLPFLEPTETLRNKYQYNNLMYLSAGYLIERITKQPWENAVRERIFKPLQMNASNFSVLDSQKAADFARPYAELAARLQALADL